jgi:hypothetical protein
LVIIVSTLIALIFVPGTMLEATADVIIRPILMPSATLIPAIFFLV